VFDIFNMYTITLNGNSSNLSCDFFPPIEVGENARICLLSLQTNNSIPNINDQCNRIGFVRLNSEKLLIKEVITIPTGSYELSELEAIIKRMLTNTEITFELKANNNTLKCEMKCNNIVDFSTDNSIGPLLGYRTDKLYDADVQHESDSLVNMTKINCIYVESNLVTGSFNNGKPCHILHEFYPNVPPGYKIIEIPKHLVSYSLNCGTINGISLALKDQDGRLIDLRGEPISIRVLIRDSDGASIL